MNISIHIKDRSEPMHFDSLEQLEKWMSKEAHFWDWLGTLPPGHALHFLWSQPNKAWNKARQFIRDYQNESEEARGRLLQQLTVGISNIYAQNQAILSSSPRAQFIETLRMKNVEEAAFALHCFLKPNEVSISAPVAIRGIIQAHLFDLGVSHESALSEKEALRVAADSWASFSQAADKEHSDFSLVRTKASADIEKLLKEAYEKAAAIQNEAEDNFKTLEHVFREKLALLAPVTYWAEKAKKHLQVSIGLVIAFTIFGCITAGLVWLALQHFVIGQTTTATLTSGATTPEYWRYTIPVAIATFLIWPMRILARMLFSNLHLREDAMERVTMANTYLALSQAREGLKEEDRKLILEMLFRPSSTGIVHDDASPPSLLNYISKVGSGRH